MESYLAGNIHDDQTLESGIADGDATVLNRECCCQAGSLAQVTATTLRPEFTKTSKPHANANESGHNGKRVPEMEDQSGSGHIAIESKQQPAGKVEFERGELEQEKSKPDDKSTNQQTAEAANANVDANATATGNRSQSRVASRTATFRSSARKLAKARRTTTSGGSLYISNSGNNSNNLYSEPPQMVRYLGSSMQVRSEQKATKVLGVVFFTFVVCWTPFFVLNFTQAFVEREQLTKWISSEIMTTFLWLGYISSTINPVIYTVFNRNFRQAFRRLLTCSEPYNYPYGSIIGAGAGGPTGGAGGGGLGGISGMGAGAGLGHARWRGSERNKSFRLSQYAAMRAADAAAAQLANQHLQRQQQQSANRRHQWTALVSAATAAAAAAGASDNGVVGNPSDQHQQRQRQEHQHQTSSASIASASASIAVATSNNKQGDAPIRTTTTTGDSDADNPPRETSIEHITSNEPVTGQSSITTSKITPVPNRPAQPTTSTSNCNWASNSKQNNPIETTMCDDDQRAPDHSRNGKDQSEHLYGSDISIGVRSTGRKLLRAGLRWIMMQPSDADIKRWRLRGSQHDQQGDDADEVGSILINNSRRSTNEQDDQLATTNTPAERQVTPQKLAGKQVGCSILSHRLPTDVKLHRPKLSFLE